MRRCRTETEPEPWIEQLILNYGSVQRDASVRAHVIGVSDLTESQRTDESDACMLFLSDGTVFIPAVLSAAAWEHMQELEERDTFSGLDNTTVSVRKFQLKFHMNPELMTCQFYLTINQLVSVGQVSLHHRPMSCTMLPSVKQQILKTWRSLMKESSVSSVSSESGLSLSCLMGAWHNDIIMDLLKDTMKKLAVPTAGNLGVATPTHWHRERLRCRAKECFSTPVSHLLIPEEQRKMLTADPGVSSSSETPSGTAPPHGAKTTESPVTPQDQGGDSPAVASDRLEDEQQLDLNNTGAGLSEGGEGESVERESVERDSVERDSGKRERACGERERERGDGERERGEGESPWDLYAQAADPLADLSSSAKSFLLRLSQPDGIIVPPFQRPHPSPHSPAQNSDPTTTDPHPLTSSEHTAAVCVEQSLTDVPQEIPHHVSHTPPAKKRRSQVHSDGSSFSYTYKPSPNVASELSRTEVPEQLVQWAVAYLGTSPRSLIVSSGVELKKVAMLK